MSKRKRMSFLFISLLWRTIIANITNFFCYKTNFPFSKTKLLIMILTLLSVMKNRIANDNTNFCIIRLPSFND